MRNASLLWIISIFFASCSLNSNKEEVLPREKMQVIILDLLRADELVNSYALKDTAFKRDSAYKALYDQVFFVNKISKETFYSSFRYYQQHPDKNRELFDSLSSWGNRKRNP